MPKEKYGVLWADQISDEIIELRMAFAAGDNVGNLHEAPGFEGAYEHLHKAIDLIWNKNPKRPFFIWNEWSELMMECLIGTLFGKVRDMEIETPELIITGPAASWKTTTLGCFTICFWLADPVRTRIIPSSTTLDGLRKRIWKDIIKFYRGSGCGFGNVVNHPQPKIQTIAGDDSSGIQGIAVEKGDIAAAVDKIKGQHAPNVLVEIDEGTGAQPAIVEASVNLGIGCKRFLLAMLANAGSHFDTHGRLSEPLMGWNSINVETLMWKTKRGGLGLHLDGHKSPNVIAGGQVYPGMIGELDLAKTARQYGENSPRYWQECRGFWPPEGITKTVLTEAMIDKFKARDKPIWVDSPILVAALDPAYGGDRCVLRFAKVGMIEDSGQRHRAIEFTDVIVIQINVLDKEPVHYQIAKRVREECKARAIDPDNFGMDSSGEGGGVASILRREWAEGIFEVEFGGNASARPVSDINPRTGPQEWVNRVTELWMRFRDAVERNQIRGLDIETCIEFCQRNVDHEKYAPRSKVESKSEMKLQAGKSPDFADAAVVVLELVAVRGLLPSGGVLLGKTRQEDWTRFAKSMMPVARYGT